MSGGRRQDGGEGRGITRLAARRQSRQAKAGDTPSAALVPVLTHGGRRPRKLTPDEKKKADDEKLDITDVMNRLVQPKFGKREPKIFCHSPIASDIFPALA